MISIIIRAKNEEKWIVSCLEAISRQTYQDYEIILVDNCSADRTVERAERFGVKVVSIENFFPGRALNVGMRASRGGYLVCLSAHCIPVNEHWLENLLRNFEDPLVAGVYGRQEPMAFTNDLDKRDLINLFGLDRRMQVKDSFFHNANSVIRRDVWEKIPFDEEVKSIEDRVWAQAVLRLGYRLVYEPEASVYHYHGINQGRNIERAKGVVRVLETLEKPEKSRVQLAGLSIVTVIPVRGEVKTLRRRPLLEFTIEAAKQSRYIKDIIVATDNREHKSIAERCGARVPFLRPPELSYDHVGLVSVYQYVLERLRDEGVNPDLMVLLEETYPFRPPRLIDDMIEALMQGNHDSVIAARAEYHSYWVKGVDGLVRVGPEFMPSKFRDPVYAGLIGLGCVTHPSCIESGNRLGARVGILEVGDPASAISVRDGRDRLLAEAILSHRLMPEMEPARGEEFI